MISTNTRLILEMEKTEHAVMVHPDNPITKEILNACIDLVDRGIALDLFLDEENKTYLEHNLFLLNKCSLLVNKGGAVYLVPDTGETRFWECIRDFEEYSYYFPTTEEVVYRREEDMPVFQNTLSSFEKMRQTAKPYLVERSDIDIRIHVSETMIMLGDLLELGWEVDRADKVIVQGIGRVEAYGRRKIRLEKNTIIKIGASNEKQSRIRAVFVKVTEELKITYDIGFIGDETKQYCSLVNSENYPHVYGIAKGNQVRFTWDVPLAKEVRIMPFEIYYSRGEHKFIPDTSLTIEIQGKVKDRTYFRKIQILVFPIPVMEEKLISIDSLKKKNFDYEIPVTLVNERYLQEFHAEEKERYRELRNEVAAQYAEISNHKFNLSRIKEFFFTILTRKYSGRKEIIQQLNSIQSYYESSNRRAGDD